jgi:hypothetical protein
VARLSLSSVTPQAKDYSTTLKDKAPGFINSKPFKKTKKNKTLKKTAASLLNSSHAGKEALTLASGTLTTSIQTNFSLSEMSKMSDASKSNSKKMISRKKARTSSKLQNTDQTTTTGSNINTLSLYKICQMKKEESRPEWTLPLEKRTILMDLLSHPSSVRNQGE